MSAVEELSQLVQDMAVTHERLVKTGMEVAEAKFRPAIRVLEREFFASLIDPDTRMKTSLQVAICHVLALTPSSITERVSEYAIEKIARDDGTASRL